jgi:hypothetical protein
MQCERNPCSCMQSRPTASIEYGWMKPYNPTVCTCIIRLSHATANFMQLVVRNWANFQLHKTVAKCQISSNDILLFNQFLGLLTFFCPKTSLCFSGQFSDRCHKSNKFFIKLCHPIEYLNLLRIFR